VGTGDKVPSSDGKTLSIRATPQGREQLRGQQISGVQGRGNSRMKSADSLWGIPGFPGKLTGDPRKLADEIFGYTLGTGTDGDDI
jgi:hypothetical protein